MKSLEAVVRGYTDNGNCAPIGTLILTASGVGRYQVRWHRSGGQKDLGMIERKAGESRETLIARALAMVSHATSR